MHFSQIGTEPRKKSEKQKSCPHQLNLRVADGVSIKHMTVLWQVTKMQTASTSTILVVSVMQQSA